MMVEEEIICFSAKAFTKSYVYSFTGTGESKEYISLQHIEE